MRLPRFIESLVNKWTEKSSDYLYDDENPFVKALERKKARKLAERVRIGGELSPEEQNFLQGNKISESQLEWISHSVEAVRDTTADTIASVLSQLSDQLPTSWASLLTQNNLQEIQIDESTAIIIPIHLRTTNIFRWQTNENGNISLSKITDEMLDVLVKNEIELYTSAGTIKTNIHHRMNINGKNMSLYEYIFQSSSQTVSMVA